MAFDVYTWVFLPFLIFFARIADVSRGTLRLIFISKGYKTKKSVAIARALITDPLLVLADEPTANLEHKTTYKIIGLMKTFRKEKGTRSIHLVKWKEVEKKFIRRGGKRC